MELEEAIVGLLSTEDWMPVVGDVVRIIGPENPNREEITRGLNWNASMRRFIGRLAVVRVTTTTMRGNPRIVLHSDTVDLSGWVWVPEWLSPTERFNEFPSWNDVRGPTDVEELHYRNGNLRVVYRIGD